MKISIYGNDSSIRGNEAIERFINALDKFTSEFPEAEFTVSEINFVFNYKEDDEEELTGN